MAFGDFQQITFVNGGSPPIDADTLNAIEERLKEVDSELKTSVASKLKDYDEYFYIRNTKEIENFTDESEFTALNASTTLSNDTTNKTLGNNSVKMLENDNTASYIGMNKNIAAIDLTEYADGGSANTGGEFIYLWLYITDTTKFTLFQFKLGSDNSNNYYVQWNPASFNNGWNCAIAQKSDFSTSGAVNWNNITHIRFEAYTTNNASGEYISCQYMQMIREDPYFSGYSNVFQQYDGSDWGNKYQMYADWYMLVYDEKLKRRGIVQTEPFSYNYYGMLIYYDCINFSGLFEIYSKKAGYTNSVAWSYNYDNYAECYIDSDTFYLNVVEAGVATAVSIALDNSLLYNERIIIFLEKIGATFRAICQKAGELIKVLEYNTSIDDEAAGDIFISSIDSNSHGFITDFSITNNKNNMSLYMTEDKTPRILQINNNISNTSNSFTSITDLLLRLRPNKIYKIEAYFSAYNAGSAIPDLKIDWSYNDIVSLVSRFCVGGTGVSASSEPSIDNNVRSSYHGVATDVRYAIPSGSGTYSIIKETIIVSTRSNGGYIQPRCAQYNTDGSNPTVLTNKSYLIVQELNQ